jgi:enoyl-CoA hydratase/carnithine racemase
MTSLVLTALEGTVATVTLNDPKAGNALAVPMCLALAEALEALHDRRDVHVIVIKGAGKHFCTGGNVKDMRDGTDLMAGTLEEVRDRLRDGLHRITRAMVALQQPTIASVQGMAIGAGCDLSLMCDMRVAAESAQFSESFLRLGLVSGIGGAWFLNRIVGPAKAMEMTLTAEFIDAAAALRHGLVAQVVATDELERATRTLSDSIAARPPYALRMAKRLVKESAHASLDSALEIAASMQAILLCGDEHKEAVRRFIEQDKAARRSTAEAA